MAYTKEEAISFGSSSAEMALDQVGEYKSTQDAIDSYRDNVRDTLKDEKSAEWEQDAWEAFDSYIQKHRKA